MQQGRNKKRDLVGLLNDAARDMNAVLLILAIGLAVLDFTCFFALEVRRALPTARVEAAQWQPATPATGAGQAIAATTTARSDTAVAGAPASRGRDQ